METFGVSACPGLTSARTSVSLRWSVGPGVSLGSVGFACFAVVDAEITIDVAWSVTMDFVADVTVDVGHVSVLEPFVLCS